MSGGNSVVEPACQSAGRSLPSKQMIEKWFTYVMRSGKDLGFYVGLTSNLERRLKEHNAGYNRSTRSRRPFEIVYVEHCDSRLEARKREKFLKSGVGREFLKRVVSGG
jgi:putative endonuclease